MKNNGTYTEEAKIHAEEFAEALQKVKDILSKYDDTTFNTFLSKFRK